MVQWPPAPDDASGAVAYSVVWSDSGAAAPDESAEINDPTAETFTYFSPLSDLGEWWISIRAQDCVGNWSPDYATFGPFLVTECNSTGIVDICDISCDFIPGFCNVEGCQQSADCNGNLIPDKCDIASGFSMDCNENGVPDECESFSIWDGGDGFWRVAANWVGDTLPTSNDHVCIDVPADVTVTHSTGTTSIRSIHSHEQLVLSAGSFTLTEDSKLYDDFSLAGATLTNSAGLEVTAPFTWTNGTLRGAGTTSAQDDVTIDSSSTKNITDGQTLVLESTTTWQGTGSILAGGPLRVTVINNGVLDIQNNEIFDQFGTTQPLFINNGTIVKSAGTGTSEIQGAFNNTGPSAVVIAQTGELEFSGGGTSDAPFDATGAALVFGGPHTMQAGAAVIAGEVTLTSGSPSGIANFDDSFETLLGATVVGGTTNINGPVPGLGDLTLNGGTINFNSQAIDVDDLTINNGVLNLTTGVSTAATFSQPFGR